MARRFAASVPKYSRVRSRSGKRWDAAVVIDGKRHILGPWRSPSSYDAYQLMLHQWLSTKLDADTAANLSGRSTVNDVCAAYMVFARQYYRKAGRQTDEVRLVKSVLSMLQDTYGEIEADDLGGLMLRELRETLIEKGWSRTHINRQVSRVKRVWKWAVSRELVSSHKLDSILALEPLKRGRTEARETPPVVPVSDETVEATLPHLPPVPADMVRFQRFTGCRPCEVRLVRPNDLDCTGAVWTYRVPENVAKMAHLDRERIVYIGPQAQQILGRYLDVAPDEYCFSPNRGERLRLAARRAARKTPDSCGNRPGTNRVSSPQRRPGSCYSKDSYRRAIARACEQAGIPLWHPNQLRHTAATDVRKQFGLEASQVILGHSRADVTQIYAERDQQLARTIAEKIG